MTGASVDFSEISFFELDRLFAASARALRRKSRRQRRQEQKDGKPRSKSRSRTPPTRKYHKILRLANIGGFTGSVERVEKTVVVTNVHHAADEKVLFQHFSKCGTVSDVKIVRSRLGNATGTVIVELAEDEAVTRACAMPAPHNELLGQALLVKRADAQLVRSNPQPKRMMTRQQFTHQVLTGLKAGTGGEAAAGPNMRKLHIKNLRPVVTEEDMRGIFKPFGEFAKFEMGVQECWITFHSQGDAQDAMTSMQGFQLVGQELQIASLSVTPPPAPTMTPPPMERLNLALDSDFGATGGGANPMANRIEVMKKLLSSHSQQGVPTVVGLQAPSSSGAAAAPATDPSLVSMPPAPKPGTSASRTLLLQNMFTPSAVDIKKDPRFYEEMREDTHDECTKFGKVLHITVDPRGSAGLIYVLYETPQERTAAELALNGRWFEGKKIAALGIDDSIWETLAAQATAPQMR
uniref:RRM domain-containing protein n=1 Tax=Zooxanthella nutricula TaxID=1333877 RepID=A0A7S2PQ13_9DINO